MDCQRARSQHAQHFITGSGHGSAVQKHVMTQYIARCLLNHTGTQRVAAQSTHVNQTRRGAAKRSHWHRQRPRLSRMRAHLGTHGARQAPGVSPNASGGPQLVRQVEGTYGNIGAMKLGVALRNTSTHRRPARYLEEGLLSTLARRMRAALGGSSGGLRGSRGS